MPIRAHLYVPTRTPTRAAAKRARDTKRTIGRAGQRTITGEQQREVVRERTRDTSQEHQQGRHPVPFASEEPWKESMSKDPDTRSR